MDQPNNKRIIIRSLSIVDFALLSAFYRYPHMYRDQGRSQDFGKGGAAPLKKGAITTKEYKSTKNILNSGTNT